MLKDLLYIDEHLSCSHYVSDYRSSFRYHELKQGEDFDAINGKFNHLVFVIDGQMRISCNEFTDRRFRGGEIAFIPKASTVAFRAVSDSRILTGSFDVPNNVCDKLSFRSYWPICSRLEYDFAPVPIRKQMEQFLDLTVYYLRNGINCEHLHEIKQKELFLVLKWFYSKEELAMLFYPMIGKSLDFKALVLENYLKVNNVNELAQLTRMGRSTFDTTFKNEFGMPARQWMLKQTAKHVQHHLMEPGVTISDIMIRFGFNSPTHFTRFCKQHLGATPTELMARQREAIKKSEAIRKKA